MPIALISFEKTYGKNENERLQRDGANRLPAAPRRVTMPAPHGRLCRFIEEARFRVAVDPPLRYVALLVQLDAQNDFALLAAPSGERRIGGLPAGGDRRRY